jgi:apolipoprotein N-acyltransferase
MNYLVSPVLSFLASALSGTLFIFFAQRDFTPYIGLSTCCVGLIPFLWMTLHGGLKCRIFSFLGFSFPIILYVGEGLWFSSRYFYQIGFIPSVFIYLVWIWFLGAFHILIFSLFARKIVGKKFQRLWMIPFFWVALEFLYGQVSIQARNILIGIFPPFLPVNIGLARSGGVYAISFGIVFINVFILNFFISKIKYIFKQSGWWITLGFVTLFILAGMIFPVKKESFKKPFAVALLQPNLQFKLHENSADIQHRLDQLLKMTQEAIAEGVDLIVWPASLFVVNDEAQIWHFLRTLEGNVSERTNILLGFARSVIRKGQVFYQNVVCLTDLNGNVKNMYIKQRLTPYTEYIPLKLLDFIGKRKRGFPEYLSSKDTDLVLGDVDRRWSTPICLEIFYPELLRQFLHKGAEFFILLSNDDAFGTSHFKEFLMRITALRAIELGLPIIRVAIDGTSAFVNQDGKVVQSLSSGQRGILYVKLSEKTNPSLYGKIGDIFGWLCVIIVILVLILSRLRRSYSL